MMIYTHYIIHKIYRRIHPRQKFHMDTFHLNSKLQGFNLSWLILQLYLIFYLLRITVVRDISKYLALSHTLYTQESQDNNDTTTIHNNITENSGCFFFPPLFRVAPEAYGSSQARGQIRAIAADPHHSHSHTGLEPYLWPTSQVTATLDYPTHWVRPGIELAFSWILVRFISAAPQWELHSFIFFFFFFFLFFFLFLFFI